LESTGKVLKETGSGLAGDKRAGRRESYKKKLLRDHSGGQEREGYRTGRPRKTKTTISVAALQAASDKRASKEQRRDSGIQKRLTGEKVGLGGEKNLGGIRASKTGKKRKKKQKRCR